MLSIRMFGVFTISVDGVRILDEFGPSGRGLSSYLFEFAGRVHRRERLADLFWSHLDPERARAALNTALWRLRKLLARDPSSKNGQNLQTNGAEVMLAPAPWLDIDTHRFGATAKRLFCLQDCLSSTCVRELEDAVEIYGGPFLDGEEGESDSRGTRTAPLAIRPCNDHADALVRTARSVRRGHCDWTPYFVGGSIS